jgi:hypothetical protein
VQYDTIIACIESEHFIRLPINNHLLVYLYLYRLFEYFKSNEVIRKKIVKHLIITEDQNK